MQRKFRKEKVYILGHSWGSLLASFVIHQYPELYYAYLGVGQMANTYESEQLSYQFVLREANRRGDQKALNELKHFTLPAPTASGEAWFKYLMVQRGYVSKYGGAN